MKRTSLVRVGCKPCLLWQAVKEVGACGVHGMAALAWTSQTLRDLLAAVLVPYECCLPRTSACKLVCMPFSRGAHQKLLC